MKANRNATSIFAGKKYLIFPEHHWYSCRNAKIHILIRNQNEVRKIAKMHAACKFDRTRRRLRGHLQHRPIFLPRHGDLDRASGILRTIAVSTILIGNLASRKRNRQCKHIPNGTSRCAAVRCILWRCAKLPAALLRTFFDEPSQIADPALLTIRLCVDKLVIEFHADPPDIYHILFCILLPDRAAGVTHSKGLRAVCCTGSRTLHMHRHACGVHNDVQR